jgi:DnaK suppressor protein
MMNLLPEHSVPPTGVPTMTPQEAEVFRTQLVTLRTALLEQIALQRGGVMSRVESAAAHFAHSEDSPAQVATERELEFAIGEHETAELAAIDAALQRIEAGTYGECIDCGVTVPVARLHAAPEAGRCIVCQEKFEHDHPV